MAYPVSVIRLMKLQGADEIFYRQIRELLPNILDTASGKQMDGLSLTILG
jgi:hypothetical protein